MNREAVASGIRKAWSVASALELGEVFSNPSPLEPTEEFRRAAVDADILYEELYLSGLRNGDYNFTLSDFSFLQFGFSKADHVRFAYYPNPFLGSSQEAINEIAEMWEFVQEGIITVEEFLHRISEERKSQHPPLTRYENAPEQYIELEHPCSHLHMGHHSDNRWPARRILSPMAFLLVVLRQYYGEFWHGGAEYKLFGKEISLDDLLIKERSDCRVLGDDLFSKRESLTFHFS